MTLVIAECGVNHDGDYVQGYRLIDAAKAAGADAVKFQHFNSQRLWGDSRIEALELTDYDIEHLAKHCKDVGIEFLCTPFGVQEVGFLDPLVKRWKVASGCLRKTPILKAVAETQKPVIMSTGMNTLEEVRQAAKHFKDLTLLHCTSAYPCPIEEVNLKAMDALREFGPVGYSDHTLGITVALAAVARGAEVIEKHLTLDRNAVGPDHQSSIEPKDFKVMVSAIRTVEEALGSDIKRIQPSESKLRKIWYG